MAAPRVPDLPASIWSVELPKDLTRWHEKSEVLHDLYISQRKSLKDVKRIMESDHGFPKTLKHSDYEHILREEFKYRKNLSADDWRLSIGPQIAGRKAKGKRSEVLLNGAKVRNVNRKIERSIKSKVSRQHAKVSPAELDWLSSSSLLSCLVENKKFLRRYGGATNHWEDDFESMVTVSWLLNLEASLKGPVLVKLIPHANDSFILAVICGWREVNDADMRDALKLSIVLGRPRLAVALIERGVQVNSPRGERTALQEACKTGASLWFIRLLVEKGADVNAPPATDGGSTALQAACEYGAELSCISFLIEKGADVNAPPASKDGFTAMQWAASRGMMDIARLLLDRGADVNALSGFSSVSVYSFARAIDFAARLDVIHFLVAVGARSSKPGLTGFDGAIERATREENFAIARLLQKHSESRSGDPTEAEHVWLRANPQACMYKGTVRPASWVAFVNTEGGGESEENFDKYLEEKGDYRLE